MRGRPLSSSEPTSGQRTSLSGTATAQISAGASSVQIQALVTVHRVTRATSDVLPSPAHLFDNSGQNVLKSQRGARPAPLPPPLCRRDSRTGRGDRSHHSGNRTNLEHENRNRPSVTWKDRGHSRLGAACSDALEPTMLECDILSVNDDTDKTRQGKSRTRNGQQRRCEHSRCQKWQKEHSSIWGPMVERELLLVSGVP